MYNAEYYYNLLRMYTPTAKKISEIRWSFVEECNVKRVLDFGCGVGWFKAYAPPKIKVDTFDIGPYVFTGIREDEYDLICFWDVLEHLENFNEIEELLKKTKYVAITVPLIPQGQSLKTWKHFKPGEHLHYFTMDSLDALFYKYNFKRIKSNFSECPPRKDIISVLYES